MKKSSVFVLSVLLAFVLAFVSLGAALATGEPDPVIINKTAHTSLKKTYEWSIQKSGDQDALTLSEGQQFLVNYVVTVAASVVGSDWMVSGEVHVTNGAQDPFATIIDVTDEINPGGIVPDTLECLPLPLEVPLGFTYPLCTYSTSLPDGSPRTNIATATLADGTTISGSRSFDFDNAVVTEETDECIDVTDDKYGDLGTVCVGESPKTFEYSLTVGPYDVCGTYYFTNIASFVTNDTGTSDQASWTITIDVPCDGGCTLTPGYWKTHSTYGPAPYDATWALIGEDTPFFSSGQSYYEVLWTEPQGGNAYYILAHAYIAAELNVLNDASIPAEVLDAWNQAGALLSMYGNEIPKSSPDRDVAIQLAGILDDYNNGYIGPGHCSE